jgi:PleD family two-component response regulator
LTINASEHTFLFTNPESFWFDDHMGFYTISLGVSEFPADTETLWSCIKFADVALYRAKEEGRNKCVRFTKNMWKEEQV